MKIAMIGKGSAGSWLMRGDQLGRAIGADIYPHVSSGYDVAVVVKRGGPAMMEVAKRLAKRVVWDIIDPWPQPPGNTWTQAMAMDWLRGYLKPFEGVPIIAATQAMQRDIASLGHVAFFVPHHARAGAPLNPIREKVEVVGYDGSPNYIARWRKFVEKECAARGWRFVVTSDLASVDIVLGLRDDSGYPARFWKSCVKLATAQGTGTPFIGSPEMGYLEQCVQGCERFVETPKDLSRAFDALTPHAERERVSGWMRPVTPTLEKCAARLREILEAVA